MDPRRCCERVKERKKTFFLFFSLLRLSQARCRFQSLFTDALAPVASVSQRDSEREREKVAAAAAVEEKRKRKASSSSYIDAASSPLFAFFFLCSPPATADTTSEEARTRRTSCVDGETPTCEAWNEEALSPLSKKREGTEGGEREESEDSERKKKHFDLDLVSFPLRTRLPSLALSLFRFFRRTFDRVRLCIQTKNTKRKKERPSFSSQ